MGCCCSLTERVLNAAARNEIEVLEWVMHYNPHIAIDAMTDRKGRSPLMIACKHGHIEAVRFLVEQANCNVNFTRSSTGETALHLCADRGEAAIVTFLLERGANALQLTTDGKTAVDYARDANKYEAVRALERYTAVFAAQLRMRRSSALQAGVGWLFGQMAKQAFVEQTGGGVEERDCWVVLTNASAFACENCPVCRNKLNSSIGSVAPLCQYCNTDFSGNHMVVTEVRELAIYASHAHARPEQAFTFGHGPIPMQQQGEDLIVSVLRINDMSRRRKDRRRSNQVAATMTGTSSTEYKKLVFVGSSQAKQRFVTILLGFAAQDTVVAQQEDERWQTPAEYLCPISKTLMRDPVVTSDGITFERDNIVAYFANSNFPLPRSPVTGQVLASEDIVPNVALKHIINEWKRRLPEAVILK